MMNDLVVMNNLIVMNTYYEKGVGDHEPDTGGHPTTGNFKVLRTRYRWCLYVRTGLLPHRWLPNHW